MRESTRYDIKFDKEKALKLLKKSIEECSSFCQDLSKIGIEECQNVDLLELDIQQIDNGFVNAVYCLTIRNVKTDGELKCIVKILPPNWKRLKTLNEVLVIKFLSENVNDFPVPTIYGYDYVGDLIGNEYIFMSKCEGVTLNTIYNELTTEGRKHYIDSIVKERSKLGKLKIMTKLNESEEPLQMPVFGCFQSLEKVQNQFHGLIGPNCDTLKGPFKSFNDYIISLIDFRLEDMKIIRGGSLSYFIPKFQQIIEYLKENPMEIDYNLMSICHFDITPNNTIVNPETKTITGVIDWEWSCFTMIDEDISEMLYNYATNDEEREYMTESMTAHLLPSLQLDSTEYWKGYHQRRKYFSACSYAMCLTCYPSWFVDNEVEQEKYIEDMEKQVQSFFENLTLP